MGAMLRLKAPRMRSISEKHTYLKAANSFPPDKEINNPSFYCKIKSEIPAIKTSLITFVALLGLVSAQNAIVNNHCDTTVYVQSFPYNNSEPGPLTTVPSGGTFSEPFRVSGSTVKVDKTRNLASPLFFGYSFQDNTDRVYYELSTEFGNPFAADPNSLSPGEGCQAFDCEANNADCYSTPADKKVKECPEPVTLTLDLCQ
ncbi:hypothetical protein N7445_010245 [Penicillium cf. griseofulvum]|nr:hypothetical protein N7445_010245 [Penicillium cf. griseofulvum]